MEKKKKYMYYRYNASDDCAFLAYMPRESVTSSTVCAFLARKLERVIYTENEFNIEQLSCIGEHGYL